MKLQRVIGVFAILIGALMAIGPWTFVHVCRGMEGMESPCHTTRLGALALGVIIVLLGMLLLKTKSRVGSLLLSLCLAASGVAGLLLPTVIAPVCEMATMHCRTHTRPFLLVISAVLVVLAVFDLVYLVRTRRREHAVAAPASVAPAAARPQAAGKEAAGDEPANERPDDPHTAE